jgi:probable rRNA maturation factor
LKISIIYKKEFLQEKESKKYFKNLIKRTAGLISKGEERKFGSLNLIFCGDEFIRQYNKKYLGHDYETDIITFYDTDEEGLTEGDFLISVDTVIANSKRFKEDFNNEIMRVVIHGLLHLCGFKDKTIKDEKKIREKENYYLKII